MPADDHSRQSAAAASAAVAAVSSAAMPAAACAPSGSFVVAPQPAPLASRPQPAPAPALSAHLASMLAGEFRRRMAAQNAQQIAQAVQHTERFGHSAATARGTAAKPQQTQTQQQQATRAAHSSPDPSPADAPLLLLPALLRLQSPPGVPLDFRSLPCLWALDRARRGGASLADLEALVARSSGQLAQCAAGTAAAGDLRRKVQTPAHARAILAAQQMQQMHTDLCRIDQETTAAVAAATATDAPATAPSAAAPVSFTHWFLSLIVHAHPTASFKHVGLRVLYLHRAALELLWELMRPLLPVAHAAANAAAAAAAAATNASSARARQLDALSAAAAAAASSAVAAAAPSGSASPTLDLHASSSASSFTPSLQLVSLDALLACSSSFAPCSAAAGASVSATGLSPALTPSVALGCTSFQSFFNLLQLVSEAAGLLDLEDEILDHYIPLLVVEKMVAALERQIKTGMDSVRNNEGKATGAAEKERTQKAAAAAAAAAASATARKQPSASEAAGDAPPVFVIHTDLELVGSSTGADATTREQGSSSSFVTPRPLSSGRGAVGTPSPPKQHRPLQHQSSLLALPLSLSLGLLGDLGSFRGSGGGGSGASSAQVSERGGVPSGSTAGPLAAPAAMPVLTNSHRGSAPLRNIAEEAAAGGASAGGMVHSSSNSALQQMMMAAEPDHDDLGSPSQEVQGGNLAESAHGRTAGSAAAAAAADIDDLDQLLLRQPLHEIPAIDWGAQRRSSLAAGGGSGSARAGSADDLLTPTSSTASSARPLGSATAQRRHPGVPSLSFGHAAGRTGPASDQPLSGHIGGGHHTRETSASRLANGAAWPASVASPPMVGSGHSHSSSVPSMPLSAASTTVGPLSTAGRNHLGDSSGVSSTGTSLAHTPLTSPTGASYAAHLLALNPRRSTNPTARSSYGATGMDFLSALSLQHGSSSSSSLGGSINNSTRVPASAKGVVPSLALALQGLTARSGGGGGGGGGMEGPGTASPQKSAKSTFSPGMTYTQRMQQGMLSPHASSPQQQQQQHLIVGAMTYGSPIRSPSFPAALPSPYLTSQRSLMTPHRSSSSNAPESSRFAIIGGARNAELDGPLPLSHAALLSSASKLVGGSNAAAAAAGTELAWPQHHIVHDIDLLSEQQVQQLINDGGDGDDGDGGDSDEDAGFGGATAEAEAGSDDEADDADADADADAEADADADDADLSLVDEEISSPSQTSATPAVAATATTAAPATATAAAAAPIKLVLPPATKIVIESPAKAASKPSSNSAKPTSPEAVELHRKPTAAKASKTAPTIKAAAAAAPGSKVKSPALSRQSSTAGLAAAATVAPVAGSAAPATAGGGSVSSKKKGVTFRPSLSKGKSSLVSAAPAAAAASASASSTTPPSTAAPTTAAPASAKPALTLMISNTLPVRGAITTPTAATSAAAAAAAASATAFNSHNLASPSAAAGDSSSSNVHPFGATHSPDGKVSTEPFATQLAHASSASAAAAPLIQPIPRA